MRGLGGLPGPRADQLRGPAAPTVPAGSANVVRARQVIVSGAGDGVFIYDGPAKLGNPPITWSSPGLIDPYGNVLPATTGVAGAGVFQAGDTQIIPGGILVYSGPPGPGNLALSLAPASGTDRYNNPFDGPGVQVHGAGGSKISITSTGPQPLIEFAPPNVAHMTLYGSIFSAASNAGAANEYLWLVSSSGKVGGDDAAIQLTSESADATLPAEMIVEFGGTVVLTVTKAARIQADSWTYPAVLANGWTIAGTGFFRYKAMPDNQVKVQFSTLVPGTTADNTPILTFPPGYVPSLNKDQSFDISVGYSAAPAYGNTPKVVMRNTGTMSCYNLRGTVSSIAADFSYPLDLLRRNMFLTVGRNDVDLDTRNRSHPILFRVLPAR